MITATSATRNGFPQDARSAAEIYLAKGLAPIPLPPRAKNPGYDGWQKLQLTCGDLDTHFPQGESQNVGILNGRPSHNTHDVDLDCPESIRSAPLLLPATGWVFGHKSAPQSHWIYKTDRSLDSAAVAYEDLDGKKIVELRGTGGLTVYPPSTHKETGERIAWHDFSQVGEVLLGDLQNAVAAVAAASLLVRHWPAKGSRHDARLALAGALTRAGWAEDRITAFVRAVTVAAENEGIRDAERVGKDCAARQEKGKTTWGWPKLAELLGDSGDAVVRKVRKWLSIASAGEPGELVIPDAPPWPGPPGAEAFYGLAGDIVRVIEPSTEADSAALLIQTLIAFGSMAGRSAHFRVEASRHFTNEFAVLVGKTSKSRKGTSWERIFRLMEQADAQWSNEQVASGVSSGEGMLWAIRDPICKPERIRENGSVRYEEVEADPGVDDKRLLLFEPEFANVLKQTERQGNTASVILRQAWDGARILRTLTKNSPARVTEGHISMIGHITQEELARYLTQTETANGFANRFLFVCADRSKLLPEGGQVDPAALDALRAELVEALGFAKAAGELRRDEAARELWCHIYGELSEGRPGLAGFLLARAEAHVMRLALLYALLDKSAEIGAPHLLAALALWDYCDRSARAVFGDSLGDPVADELLRLLRSCPQGLTRTDIRDYFQRNASADRIGRALGLLLQHKLARREEEPTEGRPRERWYAIGGRRG
jgi:hypothetical protein